MYGRDCTVKSSRPRSTHSMSSGRSFGKINAKSGLGIRVVDARSGYFEDFASVVLCTTGRCFFVFGGKIFPRTQRTGS